VEPLVINDRYEVIRRLAIGGMGEIFLARQTGIAGFRRLAILKTLRPELSEQDGFLTQFLDEARVAATLNHPNIVAVYEVGLHEGVHFIAMEYIGGIDLSVLQREAARAHQRVPFRVAASIVCAAAVGLDYAHHAKDEAGQPLTVVHRDVSPQNLMIRPDGVVKVVDFGVAQASNQLHETAADKIKGKIRYMAPEQLAGQDVDGRSDQFSLGIVLWELVTGKPLFSQSNPVDVFQRILSGDLPRAQSVVADLPDALDAVIKRMMATERGDRYARCGDVATALRAFLDGSGGAADDEVGAYVEQIAGALIADRTKDLTPRSVSIISSAAVPPPFSSHEGDGALDTQAPTRVMKTEPPSLAERTATVPLLASLSYEGSPLDSSDALLSAVEQSGVLHGDRRLATILVGQLPGWSALAAQIASVPMGSFALSRLKNLLLRQLDVASSTSS
jgi:eukaryotic-like serine/threonine-protein kinase